MKLKTFEIRDWKFSPAAVARKLMSLWVLLFSVTAVFFSMSCEKIAKSGGVEGEFKTPVVVRKARIETRKEVRRLTGDVDAWEMLPLSFKVGGRVSEVLVEEGDEVEEKQLIAVMDPRDYWLMRNLAHSQVEALQPHLKRAESLYESKALPKSELDKIEGKMRAARIQHRQAQAQLSYARLRSPISGIVIKRLVGPGDMAGPARPVIAVAKLRTVKIVFPVSQSDLKYFKKDMEIDLEAAGIEGVFKGKVHHVGYAADASTRTFPVTLAVPNDDLVLRMGMIVWAKVKVADHEGVFVPLSAVSRNLAGEPSVLVIDEEGKAASREVELGIRLGEEVMISRGISPGERIIIKGMVNNGDQVAAVVEEDEEKK